MALHIIEGNITAMKVDAIVNSTNHHMVGYSGVDQLIHEIGGPEFEAECQALEDVCVPGEAVYTNAYGLGCRYVIHTIAPNWEGGIYGEAAILRSAYRSSLILAQELNCKSVAFPLMSAGSRGYPVTEALRQAVTAICEFLQIYPGMKVYIVLFGRAFDEISGSVDGDLEAFIAARYVEPGEDLEALLESPGEDFVTMMYRFFDERDIKNDAEVYNKAFISRAAFNKIKNGHTKKPSVGTVVALAMALELPYDDALDFLASAGIALSRGSKFDIIVDYYLRNCKYDIMDLNIKLFNAGFEPIV